MCVNQEKRLLHSVTSIAISMANLCTLSYIVCISELIIIFIKILVKSIIIHMYSTIPFMQSALHFCVDPKSIVI